MKCICGEQMKEKVFGRKTLYFCDICGSHKSDDTPCDHKTKEMLFEINGGNSQKYAVCQKCGNKIGGPIRQTDAERCLTSLPLLSDFNDDNNEKDHEENQRIQTFIEANFPSSQDAYANYLKSPKWQETRRQCMQRYGNTCQMCAGVATDVHHLSYQHKGNEWWFELVALCKRCHKEWHNIENNLNDTP
jgi:hypothetical protein